MQLTSPRKWEYIIECLHHMKVPKKIIDAAEEVDTTLIRIGLDWNTRQWDGFQKPDPHNVDFNLLDIILMYRDFCTACADADSCKNCKLGNEDQCMPRSMYADNYLRIVGTYVLRKRFKESGICN